MKELSEKLLLAAAGAAVGAVGYLVWKNRDELHDLLDAALDKGKELVDQQVETMEQTVMETENSEEEIINGS